MNWNVLYQDQIINYNPYILHTAANIIYDAVAEFGVSQRGGQTLIFRGQMYVKDREFLETVNWRCALFRRLKCRARAITRQVNGRSMVKATNPQHTHDDDECGVN